MNEFIVNGGKRSINKLVRTGVDFSSVNFFGAVNYYQFPQRKFR